MRENSGGVARFVCGDINADGIIDVGDPGQWVIFSEARAA
jgi:hypothetical protein